MYELADMENNLPQIMQITDFSLWTKTITYSTIAAGEIQHSLCERTDRRREIINVSWNAVHETGAGVLFSLVCKVNYTHQYLLRLICAET
jgi:hypothetical protein